jgi:SAM-dependent methyltransferase
MKDYLPDIHYKSLSELEGSYWWHVTRLNIAEKIIRDHFSASSDLNVLDYGCGTGGFLFQLNSRLKFKSCIGMDASKQAILYAKQYGSYYCHLEPGDFSLLENKDLIFLMDVMEHIDDDALFLQNVIESMKIGAYLLISVPAHPFLFSSWDVALNHHRRYTKKGLFKLISREGGIISQMTYYLSYLVPPIYLIRVIGRKFYHSNNCEFPPVSPFINRILLQLNWIELKMQSFLPMPIGSTLFAMITK